MCRAGSEGERGRAEWSCGSGKVPGCEGLRVLLLNGSASVGCLRVVATTTTAPWSAGVTCSQKHNTGWVINC